MTNNNNNNTYTVRFEDGVEEEEEEPSSAGRGTRRLVGELGPTKSVNEIIGRAERMLGHMHENENPDTFHRLASAYYKEHGFPEKHKVLNYLPPGVGAASEGQTIVIKNTPTFVENHFFQGPYSGELFSVSTEEMRMRMLRNGYAEKSVTHYTNINDLPTRELPPSVSPGESADPAVAPYQNGRYPNFELTAGKLPPLYKADKDEAYAQQIVRAIEDRVIFDGLPYMPYKMWDPKAARSNGCLEPLTRIAKPYVAIRRVHAGTAVGEIAARSKQLNKEATEWKKRNDTETEWFTLAKTIANEF